MFGSRRDRRAAVTRGGAPRGLGGLPETVTRSAAAVGAGYTLVGAIVLLGGLGYALDEWRGTSPWFLIGGLLLGVIVGFYDLAKAMWRP